MTGLITATVTLPNCETALVRSASGRGAWRTELAAMKDAAFQAHSTLFRAGLLNDNLLPLSHELMQGMMERDNLPSTPNSVVLGLIWPKHGRLRTFIRQGFLFSGMVRVRKINSQWYSQYPQSYRLYTRLIYTGIIRAPSPFFGKYAPAGRNGH